MHLNEDFIKKIDKERYYNIVQDLIESKFALVLKEELETSGEGWQYSRPAQIVDELNRDGLMPDVIKEYDAEEVAQVFLSCIRHPELRFNTGLTNNNPSEKVKWPFVPRDLEDYYGEDAWETIIHAQYENVPN